jgi:hypothetical protein
MVAHLLSWMAMSSIGNGAVIPSILIIKLTRRASNTICPELTPVSFNMTLSLSRVKATFYSSK